MTVRKVTFATQELRTVCNSSTNIDTKIETIKTGAAGYGTNGPTDLNKHARHTHLNNTTGIAWVYPSDDAVEILALGSKNNNTGKGDSGYTWSTRGKVKGLPT